MKMRSFVFVVFFYFLNCCISQTVFKTDPTHCCSLGSNNKTDNCQTIVFTATKTKQYFETPNFPLPFPTKLICTWAIQIGYRSRIRAVIENFYLIVPGKSGCYTQTIVIRSPVVGLQMGPFCGKTGIPIINTPDNILIIQLIDLGSGDEDYKGFRVKFEESYETPNIELRPQNWFHNEGQPFSMNDPQLRYVLTEIDPKKNEELKIEVPDIPDDPPATESPPKKKKPVKKKPLKRKPSNWNSRYSGKTIPPPKYKIPTNKHEASDSKLTLEIIIGIAIGCFVVFSLTLIAFLKCYYNKRKKRKNTLAGTKRKYTNERDTRPNQQTKQNYLPYEHQNKCYKLKPDEIPVKHTLQSKKFSHVNGAHRKSKIRMNHKAEISKQPENKSIMKKEVQTIYTSPNSDRRKSGKECRSTATLHQPQKLNKKKKTETIPNKPNVTSTNNETHPNRKARTLPENYRPTKIQFKD